MYADLQGCITLSPDYESIGCYKDTSNRAIPTLEGADAILDGSYPSRKSPIAKCAVAAMRKGYSMFAVQNGGWCAASARAPQTFDKYGKSTSCRSDGEGGGGANQVYVIKGKSKYYRFQEASVTTIGVIVVIFLVIERYFKRLEMAGIISKLPLFYFVPTFFGGSKNLIRPLLTNRPYVFPTCVFFEVSLHSLKNTFSERST